MARLARAEVFDPAVVSVFHCVNRCVRRCYLCGVDRLTGHNYDHRKVWLEERLRFLAGVFGIDVLGFSILSNHFHLVLRNRPDVVAAWNDTEVARRWLRLCPVRKTAGGRPAEPTAAEPTAAELDAIRNVPERLAEIRRRLSDISWLMRMIAEPIARLANREDQVNGRFWQGRFRAVKLCDEAAVLACAAYVDLNPIRAGLAETPEASNFTSAQRRIESLDRPGEDQRGNTQPGGARSRRAPSTGAHSADAQLTDAQSAEAQSTAQSTGADQRVAASRPDAWLAPVALAEATTPPGPRPSLGGRASDKGFLPMSAEEYLTLLDWSGRQIVRGKSGTILAHLPPLLARIGIAPENWLPLVMDFGRLFHRVAGAPQTLARLNPPRGHTFHPGQATLLTPAA